jgi:transketolase
MSRIIAPRDMYGKVLLDLGEKNPKIFVLNADVAAATKVDLFGKKYKDRYINVGICEQNMVGISAGIARCGFIPIMSTFACFAPGRCYDQLRQSVAYSNANVKVISTHPGLAIGMDGAIHQSLDDIALMRELPNFVVLTPSDEIETKKAVVAAIEHVGPVYVRIGRKECKILFDENDEYVIGKAYEVVSGDDISILAHGSMVQYAYAASLELKKKSVNARVINVSSIKPIDREIIIRCAKETKGIITVEDHFKYGGLFSSVSEVTAEEYPCLIKSIAVNDRFGESGEPEELYKKYGLTVEHIMREAENILSL